MYSNLDNIGRRPNLKSQIRAMASNLFESYEQDFLGVSSSITRKLTTQLPSQTGGAFWSLWCHCSPICAQKSAR
jgi:hypothetical protein